MWFINFIYTFNFVHRKGNWDKYDFKQVGLLLALFIKLAHKACNVNDKILLNQYKVVHH